MILKEVCYAQQSSLFDYFLLHYICQGQIFMNFVSLWNFYLFMDFPVSLVIVSQWTLILQSHLLDI